MPSFPSSPQQYSTSLGKLADVGDGSSRGEVGGGGDGSESHGEVGGGGKRAKFSGGDRTDLESLREDLAAFAQARAWDQFHLPRNLALALVGEVGELCEIFQWRSDDGAQPGLPGWADKDRVHLSEELALEVDH